MAKIFGDFPLRGEGVPPLSAKVFFAKSFSAKRDGGGGPLWQKKVAFDRFPNISAISEKKHTKYV